MLEKQHNKCLKNLINRYHNENKEMIIQHIEGNFETTTFIFNDPVNDHDLGNFQQKIKRKLPDDYLDFLQTTNGCWLFNHVEDGSENQLFNLKELEEHRDIFESAYETPDLLGVSYILHDYIVINLQDVKDGKDNYMYVLDSSAPLEYMKSLNCSFESWLDRFIVCQGQKYWEWV
ncbi:SMI1/KNR4 family protein [Paenibacillus lemnae]|uniref:SMI1/KNR4 family protein n=1 Tax=Paenibacillus lemnae TaxID=1330551 RepID=A0A848M359_PAELE|nr:SMI1/KNR4 family protein [Paenibacillus lemnae]NMO95006.1 SMI1/KNR4 family protein [Paenibacillus lemnae]